MKSQPKIIILVFKIICIFIYITNISGCVLWKETIKDVPANKLLIDIDKFPKNWYLNTCDPDCDRMENTEHAIRVFSLSGGDGQVNQEVYRFNSITDAKEKFNRYIEVEFRKRLPPNAQLKDPQIVFKNNFAEDYKIGCGVDEIYVCRVAMRYKNYFVSFYFTIDNTNTNGMRIDDISPILQNVEGLVVGSLEPTR